MQVERNLANVTEGTSEWQGINWKKNNRLVSNLRQRIFRATQEGNLKKVRSLQKLMLRSKANREVSVRKVTQENKGKKTAGIDKVVVKTAKAREKLVEDLASHKPWQAKPVKRIYIPKTKHKYRPLGLPVIRDRCMQNIVKNALEPYWEAKFEKISYGFRPGRSPHDAIARIYTMSTPRGKKKWVVDADIKGAFDNINQEFLLETIGNVPGRELIKQWLKAGYVDKGVFVKSETGTPQGGVISPLLANIALHGMEEALGVKYNSRDINIGLRAVVRYADDFVVYCHSKEDALAVIKILEKWLEPRGLMLSAEKTQVRHLSEGFDFLGFNIRQYPAPKTSRTGWKLLIKPSRKSIQKLKDKLRTEWLNLKGANINEVIQRLNPIIRGWANYFRTGVSAEVFCKLDYWMFHRATRFAKRSHRNKTWAWLKKRYWAKLNLNRNDKWVFGDIHSGHHLLKFAWFKIQRHILVKGNASPDDPSLKAYWRKRETLKVKNQPPKIQHLAARQNHLCPVCGASLYNGEDIQKHHRQSKASGGSNNPKNLVLLHALCHQQVHCGKLKQLAGTPNEFLIL